LWNARRFVHDLRGADDEPDPKTFENFRIREKKSSHKSVIVLPEPAAYALGMEQKEAFAAALRKLLGKRKQSDLARRSGIKESVLSDYVNAKRFPRKENFAAVARGLGCSPTQLEELMWKLRLENDPTAGSGDSAERADPAQPRLHELLFTRRAVDPRVAADPKLRFFLEEVAASTYHCQVASSRFAAAMSALVDYLVESASPATEG